MGGLSGWFESLGFTPPDWLSYGFFPIAVILSLHYVPFVVLLVGNALRQFDSQLEESARTLGASSFQVARRIVFPLTRRLITSDFMVSLNHDFIRPTGCLLSLSMLNRCIDET